MAFHVVSSFLLRVLASKTTFWMAWIFQQPIRCFYFMVSGANTRIKKEDTTWKAMKSWARKCYNFLCTINFEVTWPFWKMWTTVSNPVSYIKINCSDTISDSDCQIGLVCGKDYCLTASQRWLAVTTFDTTVDCSVIPSYNNKLFRYHLRQWLFSWPCLWPDICLTAS